MSSRFHLLLVFALVVSWVRGDEIIPPHALRTWRQKDGLPGNEVTGVCQDRSGYLWVATPAGLARFDGTKFTTIDPAPHDARSDIGFTAIAASATDNSLLVAPRSGGLLRFEDGRFSPHPLPPEVERRIVTGLFRAPDGALWVGFAGGAALRQHRGAHQIFDAGHGLSPTHPIYFARDGGGRVWLAAGPLLARYENGKLLPLAVRSQKEQLRIASARRDGPWVISDERLYKIANDQLNEPVKINTNTSAHYIQALLEDSSETLWIGTRSRGLRRLSADGEVTRVIQTPEDISALAEDTSGNVWAGSNGGGLIRVKPGVLRGFDRSVGLVENHSLTVCQDNQGTMYFANRDGGVAHLTQANRISVIEKPRTWENFSALSLAPAATGGLWVTTSHGLLDIHHRQIRQTIELAPFSGGAEVRVTHAARNGDLWLALAPGKLGRFRAGEWTLFGAAEGLDPLTILALAEDTDATLWIGTENAGLFRVERERIVRVPLPTTSPLGAVQAIHFDAKGNGWLGTEQGGLLRLNNARGAIQSLNTRHGLPSGNITQIHADDHDVVWCGSPAGIFHLRRDELERFFAGETPRLHPVVVGPDEGLLEAECLSSYQPSVWKSREGLIWFATRQGVVAIDPIKERANPTPLTVKIHALRANGQPRALAASVRIDAQVHTVEIHYSVLSLSHPERVRARYRLLGFDDDWIDGTAAEIARYTRLPPGDYRFEVAALLAGAPAAEVADSLLLAVAAGWWQTPWFNSAVTFVSVLLIVLAARAWSHRRLRARLARLEHDSALELERARIAENIHDDLGAGLTRISLLTQSARRGDDGALLDKIYRTVSELTQSMDEIVWAVNPKNDDLESVANYIGEFAQGFLADAGIRCRVLLPDFLPARTLTTQHRHHLFLSCKEALNNVVKHAHASEASIKLDVLGDRVVIVVADNGRGFPAESAGATENPIRAASGNGLANLRARMAALDGACEISSSPGAGTVLTLTAALPPLPPSA